MNGHLLDMWREQTFNGAKTMGSSGLLGSPSFRSPSTATTMATVSDSTDDGVTCFLAIARIGCTGCPEAVEGVGAAKVGLQKLKPKNSTAKPYTPSHHPGLPIDLTHCCFLFARPKICWPVRSPQYGCCKSCILRADVVVLVG